MKMHTILLSLPLSIALFFAVGLFLSLSASDTSSLPSATVINPIRGHQLGLEQVDLLASLKAQHKVTKDAGIHATWLWQYSALEEDDLINYALSNMQGQEYGLFLEIDRNYTDKAGVQYRGRGPWYFSDGLFLVSYDQDERKKLIDTAFATFHEKFGYYPKTVGAWWINGDSLTYMQQKYGIVASLRAADQFDLDVYSIWGTPWSISYISSPDNAGIPGSSFEDSSKVVILQWAARDPTRGYGGSEKSSAYSVQDYALKGYDLSYFDYLTSVYLKKPLDNIVVGLEGGLPASSYQGQYKEQIERLRALEKSKKINVTLVKNYASSFLSKKELVSPTHYFLTKDYRSKDESFWYMSKNFRVGIIKRGDAIYLVDLRDYTKRTPEDFTSLPNSQGFLKITEPAIIDSVRFPNQKRLIATSENNLKISKTNDTILLSSDNKKIALVTPNTLDLFKGATVISRYDFQSKRPYVNIFMLLLIIYIGYFLFIFWYYKNAKKSLTYSAVLLAPLLLAYPFFSIGDIDTLAFYFDKKGVVLSPLLAIPSLSAAWRIIIVYQVIPFILLLLAHYIFTIRLTGIRWRVLFFGYLICLLLLFLHLPYFPLDRSTYIIVFGILGICMLVSLLFSGIVFYITRSKKVLLRYLFGIVVFLILAVGIVITSRSMYVITPFEMSALEVITNRKVDILYLSSTDKPIYKSSKPMLFDNYHFGERLTNTSWHELSRAKDSTLELAKGRGKLLVIPRYLGSDITKVEVEKYKLSKIFDNAQIAIFAIK